jgi:hypothetical protein
VAMSHLIRLLIMIILLYIGVSLNCLGLVKYSRLLK